MPPSKPNEIFGIQILRGLAAVAVVIHHALEVSNVSAGRFSPEWLTTSGAAGVDIFFVISGFIMVYTSFQPGREPMRPMTFLKKRALRIYPFYWVCLAAMALLFTVGLLKSHDLSVTQFLLSAALFPGDPVIGVSWTLSYEIFFYIIFGAALYSGSRQMTALIAILAIAAAIIAGSFTGIGFLADPITVEFCFGVLLALLAGQAPKGRAILLLGLTAWVFVILAPIAVPHQSTKGLDGWARVVAWGIPATVIVASSLHFSRPTSRLGRGMLLMGDASYAIYLTHGFGMIAYGWFLGKTGLNAVHQLPVVVIVSIACVFGGVVAHLAVEAPLNRMLRGDRAFRKMPQPEAP